MVEPIPPKTVAWALNRHVDQNARAAEDPRDNPGRLYQFKNKKREKHVEGLRGRLIAPPGAAQRPINIRMSKQLAALIA